MNAIEIDNLVYSYPNKRKDNNFALTIDSLIIQENDFVSLIGPNGCGKSTLLKLISNFLKPVNGKIKIFNNEISNISNNNLAKLISFVPQNNFSVFPFSVYEVVMMGRFHKLSLLGFETNEDKDMVLFAMKEMQIDHLANKGIKELSGGEAQRVFIARALAQQSKIILLDEPTSHLDIEHQIMIFEKLIKLNKELHKTILTVSHDLNLIANYSERIILMHQGKIKLDGKNNEVLDPHNIKKYFNVNAQILPRNNSQFNIIINPGTKCS